MRERENKDRYAACEEGYRQMIMFSNSCSASTMELVDHTAELRNDSQPCRGTRSLQRTDSSQLGPEIESARIPVATVHNIEKEIAS